MAVPKWEPKDYIRIDKYQEKIINSYVYQVNEHKEVMVDWAIDAGMARNLLKIIGYPLEEYDRILRSSDTSGQTLQDRQDDLIFQVEQARTALEMSKKLSGAKKRRKGFESKVQQQKVRIEPKAPRKVYPRQTATVSTKEYRQKRDAPTVEPPAKRKRKDARNPVSSNQGPWKKE